MDSEKTATTWKPANAPLRSRFAADVHPDTIADATPYPRPSLVRPNNESWKSLNGMWQIDFMVTDLQDPPFGQTLDHEILVPFPVESPLSGLRNSTRHGYLWYRRVFSTTTTTTSANWLNCQSSQERTLLHFEASDWNTTLFVNQQLVGFHVGGYSPFSFDITEHLSTTTINSDDNIELVIGVHDPTQDGNFNNAIGKQDAYRLDDASGISYTSTSGIWATVWLECVPAQGYIAEISIDTSDPSLNGIQIKAYINSHAMNPQNLELQAKVFTSDDDGRDLVVEAHSNTMDINLKAPKERPFQRWSPENPYLYNLELQLINVQQDGSKEIIDTITSYVGVRTITLGKVPNRLSPTMLLNGKPVFQVATLDQGFSPDGNYAFATDEALAFDIQAHKIMGFNTIRKHIKFETRRWYYHADRLGILVWQDLPSRTTYYQTITRDGWKPWWKESSKAIIARMNHPSIIQWTAYNEGWGQNYPDNPQQTWETVQRIQALDQSRIITDASGGRNTCPGSNQSRPYYWAGGCVANVTDLHNYNEPGQLYENLHVIAEQKSAKKGFVLGEYGGVLMRSSKHEWRPGYSHGYSEVSTGQELEKAYDDFINVLIKAIDDFGLSGAVYTQLSDVETECNGLLTYDRIYKIRPSEIAKSNKRIINHFQSTMTEVDSKIMR